ncbi:MAG: LytR/AlgR family response regulator transcription factor [Cyclobacteriaceae bacterium]
MLSTIIIDDEQHCIDRLKDLLNPYQNEIEILGAYRVYSKAISAIQTLKPDFIFLDVQLGDKTGFDLLKEVALVEFEVVFTTAYDKYAMEAFNFSALDYLLKPIDSSDFDRSVQKLQKALAPDLSKRLETLFHNLQQDKNNNKRIAIPTIEGLTFISVADIIRCQADVNYTHIFSTDEKRLTVTKTLKQFEELLSDFDFFRVHNSHLINLAYIKKYTKGKGGTAEMTDGTEIEVSVRKKELFLKRLQQREMLLP